MFSELATPSLLIDLNRLEANIEWMQSRCASHGVELRPHIKTHKMVEVARRQLRAGAAGLTCAKLGEAEAILPAFEGHDGRRELFLAHSLANPAEAFRLAELAQQLDDFVVACTSEMHLPVLAEIARRSGLRLPVMMAVDTGLGREGARDGAGAVRLAQGIAAESNLELRGIYTHEGHFYSVAPGCRALELRVWADRLLEIRDAVELAVGGRIRLWPGCSVTAPEAAAIPGVDAVRPGAYVFSDLFLTEVTAVQTAEAVAIKVLATVVDRPAPGLALIDAGSKTLSSDKTVQGIAARSGKLAVTRTNEEHGYLTGEGVDELAIGERIALVPAHVCPVINLADEVIVHRGDKIVDRWKVEARGRVR